MSGGWGGTQRTLSWQEDSKYCEWGGCQLLLHMQEGGRQRLLVRCQPLCPPLGRSQGKGLKSRCIPGAELCPPPPFGSGAAPTLQSSLSAQLHPKDPSAGQGELRSWFPGCLPWSSSRPCFNPLFGCSLESIWKEGEIGPRQPLRAEREPTGTNCKKGGA